MDDCATLFTKYKAAVKRLFPHLDLLHRTLRYFSIETDPKTKNPDRSDLMYETVYQVIKSINYSCVKCLYDTDKPVRENTSSILFLLNKLIKNCKEQNVWGFYIVASIFSNYYAAGEYTIVRDFIQHALRADSENGFTPKKFLNSYPRSDISKMIEVVEKIIRLLISDNIKEPEETGVQFGDKVIIDLVKPMSDGMLKEGMRVAASGGAGAAASGGAGAAASGGAGAAASGGASAAPSAAASGGAGAATASAATTRPPIGGPPELLPPIGGPPELLPLRGGPPELLPLRGGPPNALSPNAYAANPSLTGGRRSRSRRNGKTKKQQRQRQSQRQRQTLRSRRNRKRA